MEFIYELFEGYVAYIAIISLIILPLYFLYLQGETLFDYLKRNDLKKILLDLVSLLLGIYLVCFVVLYLTFLIRISLSFSFLGMEGFILVIVSSLIGVMLYKIRYRKDV